MTQLLQEIVFTTDKARHTIHIVAQLGDVDRSTPQFFLAEVISLWHQPTDVFATYSDADFRLGLNATQTTLGAIGRLSGVTLGR